MGLLSPQEWLEHPRHDKWLRCQIDHHNLHTPTQPLCCSLIYERTDEEFSVHPWPCHQLNRSRQMGSNDSIFLMSILVGWLEWTCRIIHQENIYPFLCQLSWFVLILIELNFLRSPNPQVKAQPEIHSPEIIFKLILCPWHQCTLTLGTKLQQNLCWRISL